MIDTHAHLNFNAYKEDAEEVIRRSLNMGVWMINIGTQYDTSKKALEIAQKYPKGVYASVGLHPLHLNAGLVKMKLDKEEIAFNSREESFDYEKYKELAKAEKVVAIGEAGLDYYWRPKTKRKLELFKEKQKEELSKQLRLAKELNLPVVFHCRMAHRDLIEFLSNSPGIKPGRAVAHGFVGGLEELQRYLNFGFYIGYNGIIFKNIEGINFKENIENTPLDKILIETDCPYLTPSPMEGRNEPIYVKYVAEKIAEIKKISYEEISRVTTENAQKLFKLYQ